MNEGYQLLANAIVLQAANDWKRAGLEMDKAQPLSSTWMRWDYLQKQCEAFFLSGWCGKLTKLDGTYILERLKKENK